MNHQTDKGRILLVDDDVNMLDALYRTLAKDYKVFRATSAEKGLAIIEDHAQIAVTISDLRMPGMDGITFFSQLRHHSPDTIRILLTGCEADTATATAAVNEGQIYRYLTKPCPTEIIQHEVGLAYQAYLKHISNRALETAAATADAANRAKSQFLATMSHEIRTPISAITALSALLLESSLDPDQEESVTIIHESASSLITLINDILDLSKIEAGALSLEHIPFSIRDVVEAVRKLLEATVKQKGLALHTMVSERVPAQVIGDPTRIRQILLNLLSNAVKFTNEGEISISVENRSDPSQTPIICFSVQDTGIGMSNAERDQIFLEYSQGDDSITRRFGGTGLGLSITHRLVTAMNGKISVETAPGVGSEFLVEIPMSSVPAASTQKKSPTIPPEQMTSDEKVRILVADDSLINQRVTAKILSKLGYACDVVSNGKEVLDALTQKQYDMILMDVEMPIMNGLEATQAIRTSKDKVVNRDITIVGCTAHTDSALLDDFLRTGMNSCLTKPLLPEKLRSELVRQFDKP